MTSHIPYLTLPSYVFAQPAVSILLPLGLGLGVGSVISPQHKVEKAYNVEKKPPYSPPAWVFAPAWTVLYTLMGYAAHRAWTTGMSSLNLQTIALAKQSATLYTIQLGLNLIFMPLSFGLNRPIEATADIVALTGTVGYLIYITSQIDEVAAWCLAPYLAWLSFATYLSAGTAYLNHGAHADVKVE